MPKGAGICISLAAFSEIAVSENPISDVKSMACPNRSPLRPALIPVQSPATPLGDTSAILNCGALKAKAFGRSGKAMFGIGIARSMPAKRSSGFAVLSNKFLLMTPKIGIFVVLPLPMKDIRSFMSGDACKSSSANKFTPPLKEKPCNDEASDNIAVISSLILSGRDLSVSPKGAPFVGTIIKVSLSRLTPSSAAPLGSGTRSPKPSRSRLIASTAS